MSDSPEVDLQPETDQQPVDNAGDAQAAQGGEAAQTAPEVKADPEKEMVEKRLRDKDSFISTLQQENAEQRRLVYEQNQRMDMLISLIAQKQAATNNDGLPFDPDETPPPRQPQFRPQIPVQQPQNNFVEAMALQTGKEKIERFVNKHPDTNEPDRMARVLSELNERGVNLSNIRPDQLLKLDQHLEAAYLCAFRDEVAKPAAPAKAKPVGVAPATSLNNERHFDLGSVSKPDESISISDARRRAANLFR